MKFAYFKEVLATGGAEGKLLQAVFPYRYLLHDAKFFPPAALLTHPTPISPLRAPAAAAALWAQWRHFWPPAPVFLDKTPEILLMAPFVQSIFGPSRSRFVFVLRHPLSWALAAAKWACRSDNGSAPIPPGSPPVRRLAGPSGECIDGLLTVWLAAHERMATDTRMLRSVTLLRAEPQGWEHAAAAVGAVIGARTAWEATHRSVLRSSHTYVHCFFHGAAAGRARDGGGGGAGGATRGGAGGGGVNGEAGAAGGAAAGGAAAADGSAVCGRASPSAAREREAWWRRWASVSSGRVEALGFSVGLARVRQSCCEGRSADWGPAGWDERGVAAAVDAAWAGEGLESHGEARDEGEQAGGDQGEGDSAEQDDEGEGGDGPAGVRSSHTPPSYAAHALDGVGVGLHTGRVALLLSSSFLSGFNGMQQRAAQIAAAVGKLGFGVHFISLGEISDTAECAAAQPEVVCHATGNASAQYDGFAAWARARRAAPTLVLLGFTSLTLEASRTLLSRPAATGAAWARAGGRPEALLPLLAPRAARAVGLLDTALADWPMLRAVVFTDDVHHLRTRAILSQAGSLTRQPSLPPLLAALRAVEMSVYRRSRLTLAISTADRRAIVGALKRSPAADADPEVRVLPFGAAAAPDAGVVPAAGRVRGRMLFVGTCHPVAKAGIAWLLDRVMPLLTRDAEPGVDPVLVLVGNGWAALREEPPFARWVAAGALEVRGRLSVDELAAEYRAARLFVAPVRNATGIATKNFHAMGAGLPLLTTALGVAGMRLPARPVGLCCEPSPSSAWPPHCRRRDNGWVPPVRPSLEQGCAGSPKRLECATYRAALQAAAQRDAAPGRALLAAAAPGARPPIVMRASHGAAAADQAPAAGGPSPAGTPLPALGALHASGCVLVADDAPGFASAALAALTDDGLWARLSAAGLRQMRQLVSPAVQAAVLASSLRDPLLLDPPAEQACVLIVDACGTALRPLFEATVSALLRLRVAVHLIALPSAVHPASERCLLGWDRAQGVFSYAGGAAEQWTAALASSAAPTLRFAVLLHDGAPAFLRALAEPDCQARPAGPRCVWAEADALGDGASDERETGGEEGAADLAGLRAAEGLAGNASVDVGRRAADGGVGAWAVNASIGWGSTSLAHKLYGLHSAFRRNAARAGGAPLCEAQGACAGRAPEPDTLPLLRLLDCIVRAQRLPLLTVVASTAALRLEARRPAAAQPPEPAAALVAVAAQYERALLAKATIAVGSRGAQLQHLRALAPHVPAAALPDGPTPAARDARWIGLLSQLLFPEESPLL